MARANTTLTLVHDTDAHINSTIERMVEMADQGVPVDTLWKFIDTAMGSPWPSGVDTTNYGCIEQYHMLVKWFINYHELREVIVYAQLGKDIKGIEQQQMREMAEKYREKYDVLLEDTEEALDRFIEEITSFTRDSAKITRSSKQTDGQNTSSFNFDRAGLARWVIESIKTASEPKH